MLLFSSVAMKTITETCKTCNLYLLKKKVNYNDLKQVGLYSKKIRFFCVTDMSEPSPVSIEPEFLSVIHYDTVESPDWDSILAKGIINKWLKTWEFCLYFTHFCIIRMSFNNKNMFTQLDWNSFTCYLISVKCFSCLSIVNFWSWVMGMCGFVILVSPTYGVWIIWHYS